MSDYEQTAFPFYYDETKLAAFLTQWCALEDEEERMRKKKRLLKAAYQDALPMRAVMAAVQSVRTRTKLAQHEQEPMALAEQSVIEGMVATHLDTLAAETAALQEKTARMVPDMGTHERLGG